MKSLFVILFCLIGSQVFSQTNDLVVQEKSSDWIKVIATVPVPAQRSTTKVKRKTTSKKPAPSRENTQEEFEKTNSQVNRFKKGKKD